MSETAAVGRAGMDVAHHTRSASARANRARILEESSRHLDPKWTAKQARKNVNVDPARTDQNVLYVNDGAGGYRVCEDVDEVLDYGDARDARVRGKLTEKSRTTTTIVGHLPKTMCEARTRIDSKGKPRTYYVPKDPEEARRYFENFVSHQADVLAGGQQAVHGWAINLDEMTPHVQMLVDNYAEDTKDPERLVSAYHRTWGSHRAVRDEQGRQMGGSVKMSMYQAQLRERMVREGFPVVLEPDPERRKRKHAKDDYIALEETRAEQAQTQQQQDARAGYLERWGAALVEQEDALEDREDALEAREAAVAAREAAIPQAVEHRVLERLPVIRQQETERARREAEELFGERLHSAESYLAQSRELLSELQAGTRTAERPDLVRQRVQAASQARTAASAAIRRARQQQQQAEDGYDYGG